jgi:hypothetical protein
MVVTQKSQSPLVQQTETWKCPTAIPGILPSAAVCFVSALALTTALVAVLEVCHQATAWQELKARSG